MKKLLVILAIILSLAIVGQAWAVNATEAINPEAEPVIVYGKSATGIEKIIAGGNYIKQQTGSGQVYVGSCRVLSVNIYSDTLGDMIGVYDSATVPVSSAWLEFEIGIAANTSSNSLDAKGIKFVNGIYVIASDSANSIVTVIYDY